MATNNKGKASGAAAGAGASAVTAPPLQGEALPTPNGYTLADFITLVLIDAWGGPMRPQALVNALENKGVTATLSGVSFALSRNPSRFRQVTRGVSGNESLYELAQIGPLARGRRGRRMKAEEER